MELEYYLSLYGWALTSLSSLALQGIPREQFPHRAEHQVRAKTICAPPSASHSSLGQEGKVFNVSWRN